MSVSGLAEGVLAGFNTMDRYERGKKMDERAERDQTMREALMANQQEQQKLNNQRYDSEVAYRKERDSLQDARQNKLDLLNEQNLRAANARAGRMEARQNEMHEWEMRRLKKAQWLEENKALIDLGYRNLMEKKPLPEKFLSKVKGTEFDPFLYADPDFADSGNTFMKHATVLRRDSESGKLDWRSPEGVERINNAEFVKAAGNVYQHEIMTGINEPDMQTGKIITGKELNNIKISDDGYGVSLGVKVTYADGTTAIKPVTENRSSSPDDMVKVIPLHEFLNNSYQRIGLAHRMQTDPQILRESLGIAPGADVKGYRKAVADLRADTQARLYKIETDSNITDAKERDRLMEAERMREEATIAEYGPVFGINQPRSGGTGDNGGKSVLSSWVGNDPQRQQFLKDAAAAGKLKALYDSGNAQHFDAAYNQWVKDSQASNTANALRVDGGNPATPTSKAPATDNGEVTINIKKPHVLKSSAEVMRPGNETMAEAYRQMAKR